MADPTPSPPQAPPLSLPPSVLHSPASQLHPDSDEFVESQRHRTAHELESVYQSTVPASPSSLPRVAGETRSRSCSASSQNSIRHISSEVPTAADSAGPDACDVRRYRLKRQGPHWCDPVVKFWKSEVRITIDEGSHRDHLALERTFLGYLRTSLAFAMTGVIIAQLFRLQHSINPNLSFGFYVLGTPLAATFISFGLVVLLIGAFRFWRQQNAMVRGKIYAGGWEVSFIMLMSIVLCFVAFVLTVGVDIDKSYP